MTNIRQQPYLYRLWWSRFVFVRLFARDLSLRYRGSVLGFLWSLLNPAIHIAVLTVVFSHVIRTGMDHYIIYLMSSMLPFQFFSNAVTQSANCLVLNENYFKRLALPIMLFPLLSVSAALFDFLLAFIVLFTIGFFFGFSLGAAQLILPLSFLILIAFTAGCVLIVSIITMYFRDMRHIVAVLLNIVYFATPILYPITAIPEYLQFWFRLNPLYYMVTIFNQPLYHHALPGAPLAVAAALSIMFLAVGIWIFRAREHEIVFIV
jgi:ABC-2 type transport system permease protein/lipopolysaccharide transport system permease protein